MFILFFFFKQKTAYEMRISDWSSDVCSSDLGDVASRILRTVERRAAAESTDVLAVGGLQGLGVVANAGGDDRGDGRSGCPEVGFQPGAESVVQSGADRECVGSGKSEAVRVDIGGRRNIENNTVRNNRRINT